MESNSESVFEYYTTTVHMKASDSRYTNNIKLDIKLVSEGRIYKMTNSKVDEGLTTMSETLKVLEVSIYI